MSVISDSTKLLSFLGRTVSGIRRVKLRIFAIVFLATLSGLANTGLLALINAVLSRKKFTDHNMVLIFTGLCVILPICRFASRAMLVRLTGEAGRDLRVQLSQSVVAAPLRRYEEHGAHRVLNVLTTDVAAVIAALYSFPNLCMQLVIVASSLVYLGILSWKVLLAVLLFMGLGLGSYQLPVVVAMRHFRTGRQHLDALMRHFRGVTEGAKELRLHQPRRLAFFREELEPAATSLGRSSILANTILAASESWGQILFFVLIGLVLFGLPALQVTDMSVLVGYSLVFLYMMTPIANIIDALPTMSQAAVAVQAIEKVGLEMGQGEGEALLPPEKRGAAWRTLELKGVTHVYTRDSEAGSFALGPINLTLHPGELVFLIGGNGSGKTTLAKLISGLYRPEAGEIRLDGQSIDEAQLPWYRQHFSAVFSDFYLFDKLLGLPGPDLDERAKSELKSLKLDHKVEVKNGALSTIDLSQGQRKRLALMSASLEDRSLYLFDEWAADQDPFFREIFYRDILPALKARGKTVIVISHDDRYYDLADRIIKLEYGKVAYDRVARTEASLVGEVPAV
ncbi:MAG TPA: cyclic peptide export ABC transporter [Thermoanaerobaculia bacterium]|nr:cyclic peptide export ABC transporter [Thermoanaerobaculia bacterium]